MIMQTKLNRKFNPHIVWNGEMKKLAFSFVLVAAVAILLENIWMAARINSLRKETNTFVAIVMGNSVQGASFFRSDPGGLLHHSPLPVGSGQS